MSIKPLYEDNHVIAAFKPAGMLSQGDKSGDISLLEEVRQYLKEKYHKPGNVFVGLLHRLDRPACGIVLFAKTSKGASRLSEQFRNRTIQKTYHVLVTGKVKENRGTLINQLGKDTKLFKAAEYAGGKEAVLHYELVESNKRYSLLKVNIEGGQFHQIRAQLAMVRLPIVGDVKYKGEKWHDSNSIALCAAELQFTAATTGQAVRIVAEIPAEWRKLLSTP